MKTFDIIQGFFLLIMFGSAASLGLAAVFVGLCDFIRWIIK
jgi:hypothetical protein